MTRERLSQGRGLAVVYCVVTVLSAFAFAAGHLPSLMILLNVSDPSQFPPALLLEIFLMNGSNTILGSYYFRKYGFLAPVGIHFWADILWHMIWGLL